MNAPWYDRRIQAGLTSQLRTRQQMLDGGARHLGWKVGFGAPAALEKLEISAPLVGFLTDATLLESGETVPVEGWSGGIVEFEVAIRLGNDLGSDASEEEVDRAVAVTMPAIELADVDLQPSSESVEEVMAGNIFHRGLVLGDSDHTRSGPGTTELVGHVLIDGEERHRVTALTDLTGDHTSILQTVAGTLESKGLRLSAGDLVITGSIVPPIPVGAGTEFSFRLEPFPEISIRVG